jgi:hypothetical protein
MVVAKINTKPNITPTKPLPKAVEVAKPELGELKPAHKPDPAATQDINIIKSNPKSDLGKLTGQLHLPDHCHPFPHPPQPFDFDKIIDAAKVEKADANKDDKLNADEFKQTQSGLEQFTDRDKFDRYDSDNDGYVTKDEFHKGAEGDRFREQIRDHFPIGAVGKVAPGAVPLGNVAKEAAEKVGDAIKDIF